MDNAFARFNTIITSLKALGEDSEIVKAKRERRSLALKDKKESSYEECSTSRSKDEEYTIEVRDFKKFFKRRGQICDNKYRVTFSEHDSKITKDGKVTGRGIKKKGLYVMKLGNKLKEKISLATIDENSTLWHRRLGHVNMYLIQSLASKELVRNLPKLMFDQHFYDACKIGKQAHASYKAKNIVSTTRGLELLHMDLFVPFSVHSYKGNLYSLVIVGKTPYELLRGRKPTLDYFKVFESYSQNSKAYIILNKHTKKIKESPNVTFDETPPPSKILPLVDDDLDEVEAIKVTKKKNIENDNEDETLEIYEIVNIKESKNHSLENVIGNLNQRTLRLESIRILLAYACALDFKLLQMDVKSAFLNGFINVEVYVTQPSGFIDFEKPDHVYKLKKALYGLKQAPKACLEYSKLMKTPMTSDTKLTKYEECESVDNTKYRDMIEYSVPAVSSSLLPLASITAVKQIVIGEYDIWAMKMQNFISSSDLLCWNIVLKGNSAKSMTTDKDGNLKIRPTVTAEEHQQVQREEKARTILLSALPDEHMGDFYHMIDARDIWNAIKARFNAKDSEPDEHFKDKAQTRRYKHKFLRGLPPCWSSIALILKTKGRLKYISFDDLYNKLKFLEIYTKGYSSSSSTLSNDAFVSTAGSSQGKLSYQESRNDGYGVYTTTLFASPGSSSSKGFSKSKCSVVDDVIYSFFANDEIDQQLVYEDLDQINKEEFEKYDLKHQMAMLSIKAKWNNSGKNLYKLIDSSMSVRTKRGLGLDKYIGEGELGIDDSKFSIFHTNSDELEGQPIYNRFASVDHMKAVPPSLTGNYMPPFNIPDIDESHMVQECSRPIHSDHDSKASISSVSEPASESRDTIVIDCDKQEDFPSVCTSSIETDVKSSKTLCNKFGSFNKEIHFRKHKSVASKSCYVCGSYLHLIKDCDFHEKRFTKRNAEGKGILKNRPTGKPVNPNRPKPVSAGRPNPISTDQPNPVFAGQPNTVSAGDGILGPRPLNIQPTSTYFHSFTHNN
nr:retrotransposon protein, putative, Ty1-copia subclass [Tanacetum cinerariifolium]